MVFVVSDKMSDLLSVRLREIYEEVVFECVDLSNSYIASAVISAVEEQMKEDKEYFKNHPGIAYAHESHNELAKKFLQKIEKLTDDTLQFVSHISTTYANITDIMAVTVPYILIKSGIESQEAALFVGLGILVSQIVIERISSVKESKEKISKNEILIWLQMEIDFIENLSESQNADNFIMYREKLIKYVEELKK